MEVKGELQSNSVEQSDLVDSITLGLIQSLKGHPNVSNVDVNMNEPATEMDLDTWEQMFSCILPAHMKNLYLCCNGFSIDWKYKIHRRKHICLGHLHLNSLNKLTKVGAFSHNTNEIPTLVDIECDDEEDLSGIKKPTFKTNCKIFELECLEDSSRICLVYHLSQDGDHQLLKNPSVWYLDSALTWHFLAKEFLDYFRLLLAHVGLPLWPVSMTSHDLPAHTKNWYQTFAPLRIQK